MSEKNEKTILETFREWVLQQESPEYTITEDRGPIDSICIDTRFAHGTVSFYMLDQVPAVEMHVTNLYTQQAAFYLHFELKDLLHAKELFEEMQAAIRKQHGASTVKVLLCCSSALTTSFFKEKLNSAAEILSLDMTFDAVSYNNLFVEGYDASVILLAPQIGYEYDKVREVMKDKLVLKVPARLFASYDVSGVLDFVKDSLADHEREKQEKMLPAERMEFKNTPCMLIISVIVEYESMHFVYRIYNAGSIIHQDEVIKQRFEIRDLEDMLDYELARYPEVTMVCINSPGVFYKGHMTFKSAGIFDEDVETRLTEKYGLHFIFVNDANAMALGFYGLQKKATSLSFYFHPQAARTAGVGNVINGQLYTGRNNLAGEMQFVHQVLNYTDDPDNLLKTPEGTMEIVARYLVSIIACLDPQEIVIYCNMIYDLDQLKEYLAHYIRKDYLPDLIKVDDVIEYMFVGGMMLCVGELSRQKLRNTAEHYARYSEGEAQD